MGIKILDHRISVLVVDDEAIVRRSIAMLLKHAGHEVAMAEDGAAALAELSARPFDLVITDFSMPGTPGDELACQIRQRWPRQPIIMATAFAEEYTVVGRERNHVDAVLLKPFTFQELLETIGRILGAELPAVPLQLQSPPVGERPFSY